MSESAHATTIRAALEYGLPGQKRGKEALAALDGLLAELDEAFELLVEAYPSDFDQSNRWRSRVEKLGAWPARAALGREG